MAMLEIINLTKSFGGLKAVNGVSFNVEKGMIKAVIGPNGAGKTTLFNLISGMLAADAGDIRFEGTSVSRMPAHLRAGLGIARTFQNIKLFPRMSVLENVMAGYHSRGRSGFLPGMLALPFARREEKEIRARALEKLSLFGLAGASDMPAASLPFGSQRGVEMARALIMEPKLLMLDEPAAGLNIHETRALAGRIADINASGVTVLIVEHDMSLVMDISHEIAVLNYGGLIAQGPPREIQRNGEVIRIYLGDDHA